MHSLAVSAERARKSPTGVIFRGVCSSIRFYDSLSALWASRRAGIYRQRTEENVLKAQLVNFHRLTSKADFILIPFLCQQEIADVAVLDPVSAHVELIQRDNIFRVVIADIVIRAELTLN